MAGLGRTCLHKGTKTRERLTINKISVQLKPSETSTTTNQRKKEGNDKKKNQTSVRSPMLTQVTRLPPPWGASIPGLRLSGSCPGQGWAQSRCSGKMLAHSHKGIGSRTPRPCSWSCSFCSTSPTLPPYVHDPHPSVPFSRLFGLRVCWSFSLANFSD